MHQQADTTCKYIAKELNMSSASTSQKDGKLHTVEPKSRSYPKPIWMSMLLARYFRGYRQYKKTGLTSYESAVDLRRLYCLTNGRFNDFVARLDGIFHPSRDLPSRSGILGEVDSSKLATITSNLRRDGFYKFENRLDADLCARLKTIAETAPCRLCPAPPEQPEVVTYDADKPLSTLYKIDQQVLHEQKEIQELATDGSLLAVAQSYLKCRPVFMGCCMWWSTAFSDESSSEAAQQYHFDMPQAKFLKIFVYLTDVGEEQGPHRAVQNTHRRKPKQFLTDRRFTDEEIAQDYPAERVSVFGGPTGTMFAEDTSSLHKGTNVQKGHRLLLQFMYATSGYGGAAGPVTLSDRFSANFIKTVNKYPRIYSTRFHKETVNS